MVNHFIIFAFKFNNMLFSLLGFAAIDTCSADMKTLMTQKYHKTKILNSNNKNQNIFVISQIFI